MARTELDPATSGAWLRKLQTTSGAGGKSRSALIDLTDDALLALFHHWAAHVAGARSAGLLPVSNAKNVAAFVSWVTR